MTRYSGETCHPRPSNLDGISSSWVPSIRHSIYDHSAKVSKIRPAFEYSKSIDITCLIFRPECHGTQWRCRGSEDAVGLRPSTVHPFWIGAGRGLRGRLPPRVPVSGGEGSPDSVGAGPSWALGWSLAPGRGWSLAPGWGWSLAPGWGWSVSRGGRGTGLALSMWPGTGWIRPGTSTFWGCSSSSDVPRSSSEFPTSLTTNKHGRVEIS